MDVGTPRADAFAIKDSRIIAVGSNSAIRALMGRRTQTYDAQRMTILPGFVDCHDHAGGTMLLYEVLVGNPFEVEFVTIDSIIEKLRAKARTLPEGTWVDGYFHDDTKLKDKRLARYGLTSVHHEGGDLSAIRDIRARGDRKAGDIVSVAVTTSASFSIGERRTVLIGDYLAGQYDVSPDGSQFLMLKPVSAQQTARRTRMRSCA